MNGVPHHGGGLDAAIAQYGGDKKDWLDLSTGINPNGYPVSEMASSIWQRLPDSSAMVELLEAARAYYGVCDDCQLVAANGTQALIEMLPKVLDGKRIAVVSPSYSEYAFTWEKAGAEIIEFARGEPLPAGVDGVVIVNPNNPDASVFSKVDLLAIAARMKKNGGWMVVDEAFCDSDPTQSLIPHLPDNVIVLRSIGKFFGLAGLRLGFAIGAPSLIAKFETQIGPWAVSSPALEIGRRALQDEAWISQTRDALLLYSGEMAHVLDQCGFEINGVNALFVYVRHDKATLIHEALAKRHILTRHFPERPKFLRIGLCANKGQLARFKAVLSEVLTNV